MKPLPTLLILILFITFISCSHHILNLSDQNFDKTIKSNKYVMVKFYAPWCTHCKNMIPQYEKLAQLLKDNDIVIAQLDATQNKQTAKLFNIQGYPTIRFFIDGRAIDYNGARTTQSMYEWIKKVTEIKLEEINKDKIQELRNTQNLVVYYGSNPDKLRQLELINIQDSSITYFKSSQSSADQILTLYFKTNDKKPKESKNYRGQFSSQSIKQWVMIQTIPIVVSLSSKQYLDWVFYDQKTIKDVFLLLQQSDISEETFIKFQQICEKNLDKFKCCHADQKVQVYGGVKNYLKGQGKSVLALTRDSLQQAYSYPSNLNELTQQSILSFIEEVNNKKHKSIVQKKKDDIQYQHVKMLNDQSFFDFLKQNQYVFVEFFSQMCHHCIQFAPKFEAMAKKLIDQNKGVVFAAINYQKNPKVAKITEVKGYPSFIMYVKGQPVPYEGSRAQEQIFKFVQATKNSKIISADSLAEIPTPSVILYDPAQQSKLKLLSSLFTKYPVYHLKQGNQIKIVLKLNEQQMTYQGNTTLDEIGKWLNIQTAPVLVNLLNTNPQEKLVRALQNKVHILSFIDIQTDISSSLTKKLEQFCKNKPNLVCGYAKIGQANFDDFIQWTKLKSKKESKIIYIHTQTFDTYTFNKQISEVNTQNLEVFIQEIKDGKIKANANLTEQSTEQVKPNNEEGQKQHQKHEQKQQQQKQSESESKSKSESENKSQKIQQSEL